MTINLKHALSVRSDFSIGESMLQVSDIVTKAKQFGYESVAVMDMMTVSSMPLFFDKLKAEGIKPIVGCRIRVYLDPLARKVDFNPSYQLKVYVLNEAGMKSVMRMLSKANTAEHFYYHSRVGLEDVLALDADGIAVSTGDFYSVFHDDQYEDIVTKLVDKFGASKTFVELVPIDTPLFNTLNHKAIKLVYEQALNTLVTYPVMYKELNDADTRDILGVITAQQKIDSPTRSIPHIRDFAFCSPDFLSKKAQQASLRMTELYGLEQEIFDDFWLSGLKNMQVLVDLAKYEFKKQAPCLPKMAENEFATLVAKVKVGWSERLTKRVLGYQPENLEEYKTRLSYELGVLRDMGFAGYFLLVQDIVKWAKSNEIIVGPGRGSVGGSLVAYLMGITEVDPIRFGLLFERFINPERLDLPDADLDFMSSKRHMIIEYLRDKYGTEYVAGISNYSTLASSSALRDVARVYNMLPFNYSCSKLVPKEHGSPLSLDLAANQVPEIDKFRSDYPIVWNHATRLEGAMRSLGQHAAGVVVAGEPLVERAVVETRTGGSVVNWDKNTVESFGLIKMDILGLATLDVLELGRQYVKKRHGVDLNYLDLSLDDRNVLRAFEEGDTVGVFQFESGGMRSLLKSLAMGVKLTFDDLAAATALYRPGPMDSGMMDDYVKVKQGAKSVYYDHPVLETALKDTNGVMIYQESVMQVARDLAGFTMAEADKLRKVMGKKDKDGMAAMRDKWVDGCFKTNEVDDSLANEIFDKISAFASYGFNKSHSVEYSIISYWTMALKTMYPAEFYAASMTVVLDKSDFEDKMAMLIADAKKKGIKALPPNINYSSNLFEIGEDGSLLAPFQTVKGISENVTNHIMEGRAKAGGLFKNEEHMLEHINKTKVNVRHRDNLERVGAMYAIKGGLAPDHADRLKDQLELLPGLIHESVKADRPLDLSDISKKKIVRIMTEVKACELCNLSESSHPFPRLGSSAKMMIVVDSPNWHEEKEGKLFEGDAAAYIKAGLREFGLSQSDIYVTSLVKAPKSGKQLENSQINNCVGYLKREIEALKPPIIVALGSASIRYFLPSVKTVGDVVGKTVYLASLDASIVCGINPAQIAFDASKVKVLNSVLAKAAELIGVKVDSAEEVYEEEAEEYSDET
jgi:DNA polymerase-3 subunit alpha